MVDSIKKINLASLHENVLWITNYIITIFQAELISILQSAHLELKDGGSR